MPKYTVKEVFRDLEKDSLYEKGEVIELTAKRADEIIGKLGERFLEKAPAKKKEK